MTSFIEKKGSMFVFSFVCEGCHTQGRLEINEAEKYKPFGCPEQCGATYILWDSPLGPALKCVVLPVFEEDEISEENRV